VTRSTNRSTPEISASHHPAYLSNPVEGAVPRLRAGSSRLGADGFTDRRNTWSGLWICGWPLNFAAHSPKRSDIDRGRRCWLGRDRSGNPPHGRFRAGRLVEGDLGSGVQAELQGKRLCATLSGSARGFRSARRAASQLSTLARSDEGGQYDGTGPYPMAGLNTLSMVWSLSASGRTGHHRHPQSAPRRYVRHDIPAAGYGGPRRQRLTVGGLHADLAGWYAQRRRVRAPQRRSPRGARRSAQSAVHVPTVPRRRCFSRLGNVSAHGRSVGVP
jgi:hypothetical protein